LLNSQTFQMSSRLLENVIYRKSSLQLIQNKIRPNTTNHSEISTKFKKNISFSLKNPQIENFISNLPEKNSITLNETSKIKNSDISLHKNKKIKISEQILQPAKNLLVFDEPLDLSEKEIVQTKKSCKSEENTSNFSKKKRIKIKKKTKTEEKKQINSSGILFGVLKTLRKFVENLKFQTIYKNYKNLHSQHLKLINDLANDFSHKENKRFQSIKTYKSTNEVEKSGFLLINLSHLQSKTNEIFKKMYRIYDKIAPKINPDHMSAIFWNFFLMIFLIFFMIMIPLLICFNKSFDESSSENIYYFLWINHLAAVFILIIDIFFRFHVGYYDQGAQILDRKRIIQRYLGKEFFGDLLAIFPFFCRVIGLSLQDHYFELLFFFKVFRLKEILMSFETKLCLNDFYEGIFNLVKVVCKILYIAHIIACLFHSIGSLMIDLNERSWLNLIGKSYLTDWKMRYIYSIYWAVTTLITVGYGDITPQNPFEILFTIFVFLIGCGTFAYGINSVGSILMMMMKKEQEFQKEVKVLNNFMRKNNLDSDLQMRLREYFLYIRKEENAEDHEKEQAILQKLSSSLQYEVILHTIGFALKKIKLFSFNFSELFLQKLVLKMKQRRYVPEDIIFDQESQEDSIYFIMKGQIELFLNESKLCILSQDQSFNEIPFLTNSLTRYGAKSLGYTSVFYIPKKDFLELLKEFPQDFEKFCEIRDKIMLYKEIEDLHMECSLCGKMSHFIRECPFINTRIDHWNAVREHRNSYKYVQMERSFFQRRKANAHFRNSTRFFTENFKTINRKTFTAQHSDGFDDDLFSNPESQNSSSHIPKANSINFENSDEINNLISREKIPSFFLENQKIPNGVNNSSKELSEDHGLMGHLFRNEPKEVKEDMTFREEKEKNKKNEIDLFWKNMDHYKSFEHYFRKNNCENVIKKLIGKKKKQQTISEDSVSKIKCSKNLLNTDNANIQKKNQRSSFFKMESPILKKKNGPGQGAG